MELLNRGDISEWKYAVIAPAGNLGPHKTQTPFIRWVFERVSSAQEVKEFSEPTEIHVIRPLNKPWNKPGVTWFSRNNNIVLDLQAFIQQLMDNDISAFADLQDITCS